LRFPKWLSLATKIKTRSTTTHHNLFIMTLHQEKITFNIETHLMHHVKLALIYSALMDGWSVKMLANKLCFSKKIVPKHYSLQLFLQTYMPPAR
jgi:hypothetical protein